MPHPMSPITYTGQLDTRLLHSCWSEAEHCGLVSSALEGLRNSLAESFHIHMSHLAEEIRTSSRILRDLFARSHSHPTRVPVLLESLNVILPCLSKSLHDIEGYIDDRSISKEIRWRKMWNKMAEEAGGVALPQRFMLYNHFLVLTYQSLTGSVGI